MDSGDKEFSTKKKLLSSLSDFTFSNNVIKAFLETKRTLYMTQKYKMKAHIDSPFPTFAGQTISAMHMVLLCLSKELLDPKVGDLSLDVGTGSGYACAVLARATRGTSIFPSVYSCEVIQEIAAFARRNLKADNLLRSVTVKKLDCIKLLKESGMRFDKIQVAASPAFLPIEFIESLRIGGRLIIPIGKAPPQFLYLFSKKRNGSIVSKKLMKVSFVPLVHSSTEAFNF